MAIYFEKKMFVTQWQFLKNALPKHNIICLYDIHDSNKGKKPQSNKLYTSINVFSLKSQISVLSQSSSSKNYSNENIKNINNNK